MKKIIEELQETGKSMEKKGSLIYSTDRKNEANKMFIIWLQIPVEAWKKFRTSREFEPVTSRYPCDALTNWAVKPLMLRTFPLGLKAILDSSNLLD